MINSISKPSTINQNKANLYIMYLIAGLMIVIPACITRKSAISSIGFFVAVIWILIKSKNLFAISVFCLLMKFNANLCEIPIIGLNITLMPLVILVFVVSLIRIRIKTIKLNRKNMFLMFWGIYIVFNNAINGTFDINSVLSQLVNILIAIYFLKVVERKGDFREHLLSGVMAAVSLIVLVGIVEIVIRKTFFYSLWRGGESIRFGMIRPGSTLADPNFMAIIVCGFLFFWKSESVYEIIGKQWSSVMFFLSLVVIVASGSRTTYLILALCVLMLFLCKKKTRIIFALPILIMIVLILPAVLNQLFFSTSDASTSARMRIVLTALEVWKTNKVLGLGYGAFSVRSVTLTGQYFDTMNTYVQQLLDYGLIGLSFYLIYGMLLILPNIMGIIVGPKNKEFRRERSLLLASIVAWFGISLSLDTYTLVLFWIYPALSTIVLKNTAKENNFG